MVVSSQSAWKPSLDDAAESRIESALGRWREAVALFSTVPVGEQPCGEQRSYSCLKAEPRVIRATGSSTLWRCLKTGWDAYTARF